MSSLQEDHNSIILALNHKIEVLEFEKSMSPSPNGIVALKQKDRESISSLNEKILSVQTGDNSLSTENKTISSVENVDDSKTNLKRIIIPLYGRNKSLPGMNEGAEQREEETEVICAFQQRIRSQNPKLKPQNSKLKPENS